MGVIQPQPGYQTTFCRSNADIVIGGGSAGVGKTFSLLMEPLYHYKNPKFGAVFFRRTSPEITAQDGLWDEANSLYGKTVGGLPLKHSLTWYFPKQRGQKTSARIKFTHLEKEDDKYKHKGAQYTMIAFDELTSFTSSQFWYLFSRNRSVSGIRPFIRSTTNPQTEGWVKDLIQWWIYPDDYYHDSDAGYPIPERDGVKRYLFKKGDTWVWGDSMEEGVDTMEGFMDQPRSALENLVKSVTFIGGSVYDNKKLLSVDPGYLGNLFALPEAERMKQLEGCWKFQANQNDLFHYAPVSDLFTNDFIKPQNERYITADIAHQGADKFVIMVWDGWKVIHVHEMDKCSSPQVINTIRHFAAMYEVPVRRIVYDADGVGDYLNGFLETALPFKGGMSPQPFRGDPKPQFENLRTQCYYMLAEAVQSASIHIASANEDQRLQIIKELRATKRKESRTGVGKLMIIPKKEIKAKLGNSPDYADCLMMRMAPLLDYVGGGESNVA